MGSCEKALFNDKSTPNADFVAPALQVARALPTKRLRISAHCHIITFYMGVLGQAKSPHFFNLNAGGRSRYALRALQLRACVYCERMIISGCGIASAAIMKVEAAVLRAGDEKLLCLLKRKYQ